MSGRHPSSAEDRQAPETAPGRNLILTGFMGTGKSTIGRRLARQLGWTFCDTDAMIEERAGKPIPRIFAEDGEAAFRRIETEVARGLAELERHVIATGGGIVVGEGNLELLESAGRVVLLEATPEAIWRRVRHSSHRPLLAKPDPLGEIKLLLKQRAPAYGRIRIKIDAGRTVPQVVRSILERIEG